MTKTKYLLAVITTVFLTVLDQLTKQIVVSRLDFRESKSVIDGFFYIHYVRNTGSAFSFLADRSWGIYVLSVFSLIMAFIIMFLTYKALSSDLKLISVCGVLLVVGAVGNLIDRIRLGYVIDFLRFDFASYTFPIFNVADICAVIGTALFVIVIIFKNGDVDTLLAKVTSKKEQINDETDM